MTDLYLVVDIQRAGEGVMGFKFNANKTPGTTLKTANEIGAGFRYKV